MTVPEDGPIGHVLRRRQRWLETLSHGHPDARAIALHDLADDGRTEDRIRQGYTGRAAIELLQNAHDAMADARESGSVTFVITPTALLVANQGQPFDAARIMSLTRLGSSEKASRRQVHRQIGYKGIGFTAVFEVADRPQILSRDVGFAFDRAAATALVLQHLGEGLDGPVPARYFPLPLDDGELGDDEAVVGSLFDRGIATVIRLPFRPDRARSDVVDAVRETLVPEILLFMPAVQSFTLLDGDLRTEWRRRAGSRTGAGRIVHLEQETGERVSWLVARSTAPVDAAIVNALDDELWTGIRSLGVGAAIPWSDRGPRSEIVDTRIYSYFPTDDRLGRGILMHADFYLDAARRRLELSGRGGAVTRAAVEGVAGLAADLVASVGNWGHAVLAACTPLAGSGPAGALLGERLEAALASRAMARPYQRRRLSRPDSLVRLGLDIDAGIVARLAKILEPNEDILDPAEDQGEVRELLDRLGTVRLTPTEVAERVDLAKGELTYDSGLNLLSGWLETTGSERTHVLGVLRGRRVVQDLAGTWTQPELVERRSAEAPSLPEGLGLTVLKEPHGARARAFVDALGITVLGLRTALARLLDAQAAGEFGRTDNERRAALELAWAIWLTAPSAFEGERRRIGMLRVPARTARAKVQRSWRRADATYFGADAIEDRTLEQLYAPLGQPEFLADSHGRTASERRRRRQFCAALGVASRPRQVEIAWPHAKHLAEWRNEDGHSDAWECVNGHPQSVRRVTGWMVDKLDDILEQADDQETAAALARGLAMLDEPYGPQATVQCTNGDHGGRAPAKPVTGYQRWRLEQVPWVPVSHDPAGATLQLPARAWRGIPRTSPWLLVPRARLRQQDAEALDLVFAERPSVDAVEMAMSALAERHPDLEAAPSDVRDTADWLLRRLERVLVKTERNRPAPPPLPTQGPVGWRWSTDAVVPNVPGLPKVRGLDLLPAGRWTGLKRAYGLALARDRAAAEIRAGARRQVPLLLTTARRVHLLGILLRRTGESERTAARLAAIRERPVASLELAWRVDSELTHVPGARFVLEPTADKQGHVIGAGLTWAVGLEPDSVDLGRALAEYLELAEEDSEIALFLSDPDRLVQQRALTRGELDDADYLLRSRRYFVDATDRSAGPAHISSGELDPDRWAPPQHDTSAAATTPDRPVKAYIDPLTVTFGTAKPVQPKAEPATHLTTKKEGRSASTQARSLARPLAAAPADAVAASASGKRSEETAVGIVARFGAGLPHVTRIVDVQDENLGWDLEFHLVDGRKIPVEVKGSSGSGAFVLTANEWEAARANQDYVLYHVVDLTTPARTRMRVFEGLGRQLTQEHVAAAGWAVTGWRNLRPVEIPVVEPSATPLEVPGD